MVKYHNPSIHTARAIRASWTVKGGRWFLDEAISVSSQRRALTSFESYPKFSLSFINFYKYETSIKLIESSMKFQFETY